MSPYGMPRNLDTPEINKKLEDCVSKVMKTGKDKSNSVAICKNAIMKKYESTEQAIAGYMELENKLREEIYTETYQPREVPTSPQYNLVDVFDTYFIVCAYNNDGTDELYKINYSLDGDKLKIDWGAKKKVKQLVTYEQSEEMFPSIRYFEIKEKIKYDMSKYL